MIVNYQIMILKKINLILGYQAKQTIRMNILNLYYIKYYIIYQRKVDTMSACQCLSKQLRIKNKDISFYGTKDRRAVTVQYVAIKGITEERLSWASSFFPSIIYFIKKLLLVIVNMQINH